MRTTPRPSVGDSRGEYPRERTAMVSTKTSVIVVPIRTPVGENTSDRSSVRSTERALGQRTSLKNIRIACRVFLNTATIHDQTTISGESC